MGIPEAKVKIQLWRRNGGLVRGIKGYYEKLLRQRQISPFDWDVIVQAREITVEGDFESRGFFIVTKENKLKAKLASLIWLVIDPKGLALKNSSPTVTISEMAKLLKDSNVETSWIKPIKNDPLLYSSVLLEQIQSRPETRAKLEALLMSRGIEVQPPLNERNQANTDALILASPDDLARTGERLDILASRLLTELNRQSTELVEAILAKQKTVSWGQGKMIRSLNKKIELTTGLRGIAEAEYLNPSPTDWNRLATTVAEIRGLMNELNSTIKGPGEDTHDHDTVPREESSETAKHAFHHIHAHSCQSLLGDDAK
jgi:hypothetical protein